MAHQTSDIGREAEAVIDRLTRVARSRPLDRARAESALADHLAALGLEPRPVRWIDADDSDHVVSARKGFVAAWAALWKYNEGRPGLGETSTATSGSLHGTGLRKGGLIGTAEKEEKKAGRGTKRATRAALKVVLAASKRLERPDSELQHAAADALEEVGLRQVPLTFIPEAPGVREARAEALLKKEIAVGDASEQAFIAAFWLARAHVLRAAGQPAEALERVADVYRPLVDGVEAGLWLFWVTEDDVIAVATPAEA